MKTRLLNNKSAAINVVFLIIHFMLQLFLAMHHEAWRDESQAWIIARNASFSEILGLCPSEGHPCLWFFLLKVCCMCGVSFYSLSFISIVIMAVAVGLLLWKAPFGLFTKVCVLLSPVFFYYNPVICRIYSVVVLLIVLLCVCWPERRRYPITYGIIVALLFQSHILIAGLAIGCLIEIIINYKDLVENKNAAVGFIIPIISFIFMILELRQTSKTETFINITAGHVISRMHIHSILGSVHSVSRFFDAGQVMTGIAALFVCFVAFLIYIHKLFKDQVFRQKAGNHFVVVLCGFLGYWGIIVFIRSAEHVQMASVFLMIMLFFVWTETSISKRINHEAEREEKSNDDSTEVDFNSFKHYLVNNIIEILFLICCLLLIPKSALIDPLSDVKGQFSGGMEMAAMVDDIASDGSVIALHNDMLCTSIAAYLYESENKYTIWDIDNGCEFRIHKWGRMNKRVLQDMQLYEIIKEDCGSDNNVYFINSTQELETTPISSENMKVIGRNTEPNTWSEYYQLYELD